jgi:hypothetical protein
MEDAIRAKHNSEIEGRRISVKEAIPQDQIPPGALLCAACRRVRCVSVCASSGRAWASMSAWRSKTLPPAARRHEPVCPARPAEQRGRDRYRAGPPGGSYGGGGGGYCGYDRCVCV